MPLFPGDSERHPANQSNSENEVVQTTRAAFIDRLHRDPELDVAFCAWLQSVDGGYIPVLDQLKAGSKSVDLPLVQALLSDFSIFVNLPRE